MKYGFTLNLFKYEDETIWIAESNDLKGCVGQGSTPEAAIDELNENEKIWIEAANNYDIPIPSITIKTPEAEYSGKLTLRLGKTLHKVTAERAKNEGLSINQYIMIALNEYNSASSIVESVKKNLSIFINSFNIYQYTKTEYTHHRNNGEWIKTRNFNYNYNPIRGNDIV